MALCMARKEFGDSTEMGTSPSTENELPLQYSQQEVCHEQRKVEQLPGAVYLGGHLSQMDQNQWRDR